MRIICTFNSFWQLKTDALDVVGQLVVAVVLLVLVLVSGPPALTVGGVVVDDELLLDEVVDYKDEGAKNWFDNFN